MTQQSIKCVDNSQGHSTYPPDALCVSQMNLNLGGANSKYKMVGSVEIESCEMYSDEQLNIPTRDCIRSKHNSTCAITSLLTDGFVICSRLTKAVSIT